MPPVCLPIPDREQLAVRGALVASQANRSTAELKTTTHFNLCRQVRIGPRVSLWGSTWTLSPIVVLCGQSDADSPLLAISQLATHHYEPVRQKMECCCFQSNAASVIWACSRRAWRRAGANSDATAGPAWLRVRPSAPCVVLGGQRRSIPRRHARHLEHLVGGSPPRSRGSSCVYTGLGTVLEVCEAKISGSATLSAPDTSATQKAQNSRPSHCLLPERGTQTLRRCSPVIPSELNASVCAAARPDWGAAPDSSPLF
ncbi:hypothetical protein EYF80_029426 [Liparis tanakae]|uniref:Uncharacterized protein n=1 Tax=Liparis tanakae TaxID=230148 RepID=A0A4Z2H4Y0_9TELE|nr:hypothetical protein EYF80_029426 [Liparis tanakae]